MDCKALSQDEIRALIAQMKVKGVQFAEGLDESELRQIEQRHFNGARFPPDLRDFLQVAMPVYHEDPEAKHRRTQLAIRIASLNRRTLTAIYLKKRAQLTSQNASYRRTNRRRRHFLRFESNRRIAEAIIKIGDLCPEARTFKFPNWRDPEAYEHFKEELDLNNIGEEIMFDIAENGVWYWGDKPSTVSAAQKKVRGLLRKAPKLIPICNRRFMATEPQSHGQPVLSIFMATDIIFYGKDLADFLSEEFEFERVRPAPRHIQAEIPFWHALATANEERCT